MSESRSEIQAYGITTQESVSVFTQALIDMRNGGISAQEGLAMSAMVDAMSKRMQVRLNAVKLQLQCKQMGEDFGSLIKNSKRLVEDGYDEQEER